MRKIVLIALAVLGNAAVIAVTYQVRGWNAFGAALAARNTARFSSLAFMAALLCSAAASSGSTRLIALASNRLAMMYAFVAAHLVHYSAVALQAFINPQAKAHLLSIRGSIVVAFGLTLVVLIGISATVASRSMMRIHRSTVAIAMLAFFIAYLSRAIHGKWVETVFLLLLIATITIRARWRIEARKRRTAAGAGHPVHHPGTA